MTDFLCKIKIKIRDYYPKLKIIPFKEFFCLLSFKGDNFSIPLKNIETIFYESEPEKINSDLIYNVSLMNYENKYLISKSSLIIPYIRIIQVIKMKSLKYEQQIRLFLEKDIKEKIFGPGISVGSIFLKFIIEINVTKYINSNISLPNDIIIRNNSKYKLKNVSNNNTNSSISNLSSIKNKENIKNNDINQNYRLTTKNSTNKSNEFSNNICTPINKIDDKKNKYLYTHTSPFALKNNYKNQSEQVIGKKKSKRYYSYRNNFGFLSPNRNVKKLYENEKCNRNINLKKYYSRRWNNNDINIKNIDVNIFPNCFSESRIQEKKEIIKHKTQKGIFKNINRKENNKNIITIKKEDNNNNNNKKENNSISKSIESHKKSKKEKNKKIPKKVSKKLSKNINNNKSNIVKNTQNNNDLNNSIHKLNKKLSLKCKTTKNFYKKIKGKKRNEKNEQKENLENKEKPENKTMDQKIMNSYENKIKDLDFIKTINTQEDLKNNIISIIDYFKNKNKETNKTSGDNINKIISQYFLYREKLVLENKKLYSLKSQNNIKDFKNFIHVRINCKYNNTLFNKMSKVKIKEFNIIKIILNNKISKKNDSKNILEEKLKQQKQMLILLNLIRDLIKSYGNLSHLYDDDNNNKILIKSLFLRYNIREKDWNNNNNLLDIYNKMINEIKKNKNKEKKKEILSIKEEFKAIKEEEENEIDEDESIIKEKNETINKEESFKENNDQSKEGSLDANENDNNEQENYLNKNDKEKNINEKYTKEKINKYDNNIINIDENINTNNISKELLKNKNIIINNFIINK